jgi:heme/copper-type cytochrome/quinol oxidase subunit 2
MKLLKKLYLATAVIASFGFAFGITGQIALAATTQEQVCSGVNLGDSASCDDEGKVNSLLKTILNIISWVAGIIVIIMIIISGIKFATSGGSSEKVSSAKGTLTYALVGMVIVILAQVIVRFVLKSVAGED